MNHIIHVHMQVCKQIEDEPQTLQAMVQVGRHRTFFLTTKTWDESPLQSISLRAPDQRNI